MLPSLAVNGRSTNCSTGWSTVTGTLTPTLSRRARERGHRGLTVLGGDVSGGYGRLSGAF